MEPPPKLTLITTINIVKLPHKMSKNPIKTAKPPPDWKPHKQPEYSPSQFSNALKKTSQTPKHLF